MHTFWANGYDATTTEDLCAATGLGRSSIYNTFTSKHELFRRALLRYVDSERATAASRAIYESVFETVYDGLRTPDLGGQASMTEYTNEVIRRVKAKLEVWEAL